MKFIGVPLMGAYIVELEPAVVDPARDQMHRRPAPEYEKAMRPEDIHETVAGAWNVIMPLVVLLRVGHVNLLTDRLNAKRSIVAGNIRISKRLYIGKIRVIHLNLAVAEVRGIDERPCRSRNNCQSLVDRSQLGVINAARFGVVHYGDSVVQIGTRIPSRQRAVLRGKNKERGAGNAVFTHGELARAVENNARRSSAGVARRRRHRDD